MNHSDESTRVVRDGRKKPKPKLDPAAESVDIPGVMRVVISPRSQNALECRVGKDVTPESPWKYVAKGLLSDDDGVKEFSCVRDEVLKFPREEILLGYNPSADGDRNEFLVCLSEPAEGAVKMVLAKMQNDLRGAIVKVPKPWATRGSEEEVEQLMNLNNRNLIVYEIEAGYPTMFSKHKLRLRLAENQRDGYGELLSSRTLYSNVLRAQIDAGVQRAPQRNVSQSQTTFAFPRNAWTQYAYHYEACEINVEEDVTILTEIFEMAALNKGIDLYKSDYKDLVRNPQLGVITKKEKLKECMFFSNRGKFINSVVWHCFLKGIVAISYSSEPSAYHHEHYAGNKIANVIYQPPEILVWSLNNDLNPTLQLETKKTVNVLSFCTTNSNILLGGCSSGQIIVWNLDSTFEDDQDVQPSKSKCFVYSKLGWAIQKPTKTIRACCVSSTTESHTHAVTGFDWLPASHKLSKLGHFQNDTNALQFLTSSLDGSVTFWNLSVNFRQPENIFQTSRTNFFTAELSAVYIINMVPESPSALLTSVHLLVSTTSELTLSKQLITVTLEGDFIKASWEGTKVDPFEPGVKLHKETCKIENFAKYHDGPVTTLSRSPFISDIFLSVGGKILCIWKGDFPYGPILWRRCAKRYTSGEWDVWQASIFRLTRSDGYLEIWDLQIRNDSYVECTLISGGGCDYVRVHPHKISTNIFGTVVDNGTFRLMHSSQRNQTQEELVTAIKLLTNFSQIKEQHIKWQRHWNEQNRPQPEPAAQVKKPGIIRTSVSFPKAPQATSERRQLQKEKERLANILLQKKRLDKDALKEQRQPLIDVATAKENKLMKQKGHLRKALSFFDHEVAVLFPEAIEIEPPKTPDVYAKPHGEFNAADVIKDYQKIVQEFTTFVEKHPYTPTLNWSKSVREGRERRKLLDCSYGKYNHRYRLKKEKEEFERKRQEKLEQERLKLKSTAVLHTALYSAKRKPSVKPAV